MHKPNGQSVVTSTVAASARLSLHPAPSSHILCPQRQMAGHSLNLFKIVNPFLEAALIHSTVSRWLVMFCESYCHFHLVLVFVPWQSFVSLPKKRRDTGARGRVATGHLCVIAEAILEPQLLLRKSGSLLNYL